MAPRGDWLGKTTLARRGFGALLTEYGQETEHVLSRMLREAGGDELWCQGMLAEIAKPGWCPTCKCGRSPTMYRTYVRVRRAERDGVERLAAMLETLAPHREAVEQAEGMDDDAVHERAVRWLAAYHAVPEVVMRAAIEGARAGNLDGLAGARREVGR